MSLIDRRNKLIFIHIYKTGGTSVRSLMDGVECNVIHCSAKTTAFVLEHSGHLDDWNSFFKFSIVRNPYDFAISLFHHLRDSPIHAFHSVATGIDVNDFIRVLSDQLFRVAKLDGDYFFNTQFSFVSDDDELIVDRVFRFESIDEMFDEINRRTGHDRSRPFLNVSETRDRSSFEQTLNADSIRAINSMYYDDFVQFNYQMIHP